MPPDRGQALDGARPGFRPLNTLLAFRLAGASPRPFAMNPTDGLRFTCQPGCTRCCRQDGFVYLTEEDLRRAAVFLGMSALQFERRFVYRTRRRMRLRKPPGRQCPFLLVNGCAIHPAKPTQRRLFPFWPEIVSSRQAWRRTARSCPGIGQGPLIQIGTALETASEMEHAYPALYGHPSRIPRNP